MIWVMLCAESPSAGLPARKSGSAIGSGWMLPWLRSKRSTARGRTAAQDGAAKAGSRPESQGVPPGRRRRETGIGLLITIGECHGMAILQVRANCRACKLPQSDRYGSVTRLPGEHVFGPEADLNLLPRIVFDHGQPEGLAAADGAERAFGRDLEQGMRPVIGDGRLAGKRTVAVERESAR